jgi:isoleucyl-tRNA synthetase
MSRVFVKDELGNEVPVVDKQGKFLAVVGEYLAAKMKEHSIQAHKEFGA